MRLRTSNITKNIKVIMIIVVVSSVCDRSFVLLRRNYTERLKNRYHVRLRCGIPERIHIEVM